MSDRREPERTRPNARLRAGVFLIVLAGLLAAVFVANRRQTEPPVEQLRRQLREQVPAGAGRDEIATWAEWVGGTVTTHGYAPADLPAPPQTTLAEVIGLSRAELASFVQVLIPWGRYRVWRDGSMADNHLWVLFPLDPTGRVTGHHLLTLEELAEIERRRLAPGAARNGGDAP